MKGKLMIQGTASSVGKSLLCAALCRIMRQDGYRVVPFKSQNMALNSFVTREGLEMGRAQVMQAEAAGVEPQVDMNPVLLKPTSERGSQVIVKGKPLRNMEAMDYVNWKEALLPGIEQAFARLSREHDVVLIEGAGSPAEINLREKDLVNMGLATRLQAPVLLAGDIDRGGVFASLYGTIALLEPLERELIKGVIINKFRGDKKVLAPGLTQLEELIERPVLGVVPFLHLNLDDEDSVTERFSSRSFGPGLNVQVILLPRISNFTDFNPLELYDDLNLSYIRKPGELGSPDLLIIPGSKNTIEDLLHLQREGWEKPLKEYVGKGGLLMGICGGFQMLGRKIRDPQNVESTVPEAAGLGFIDMETVMEKEKSTRQVEASWHYSDSGFFAGIKEGAPLIGYEIHMGYTLYHSVTHPVYVKSAGRWEGAVSGRGNVFGTYMHGIFDNLFWSTELLNALRRRKGLPEKSAPPAATYRDYKEKEYDHLAATVRENLDLEQVYKIIG
ncbi:MAG: cobyric acid synthase [Bacillota bacterium]